MTEQPQAASEAPRDIAPARSRRAPSALLNGLLFGILSALFALQPFCTLTLARLFSERGGQRIQEEIERGLPVPRGLAWNGAVDNIVETLGNLTPPAVLAVGIAVVCIGLYALIRILNSSFRLTSGVDWDHTVLTRTYMHTPPLLKAFLIGIGAFLPAFGIWIVVGMIAGGERAALLVRLVLIGAGLWLLFSREGVAGDFESGGYELPARGTTTAKLLLCGGVAGFGLWLALRWTPVAQPDLLFRFYRSLGGIGETQWLRMAATIMGIAAVRGFFAGSLFVSLGATTMPTARRLAIAVAAACVLLAAIAGDRYVYPAHLRSRFDFDATAGRPLDLNQFSARSGAPLAAAGEQVVLIPSAMRTGVLRIPLRSVSGVQATPGTARNIRAFLEQRGYQTAFLYPAFVTLHDTASLDWDVAGSLQVGLTNLTRCPEPKQLSLFLDKLRNACATPDVVKIADRLADDSLFEFNDRDAATLMGDIYARFGDRAKAEVWYRRAGIPTAGLGERLDGRVAFTAGRVSGRILLNGKPVTGARVGLVPMEGFRQIGPLSAADGTTSPFWLWWISAATTTDVAGQFTLDHVVSDPFHPVPYRLILSVPGMDAARASAATITNAPGMVEVSSQSPSLDLGDIGIAATAR